MGNRLYNIDARKRGRGTLENSYFDRQSIGHGSTRILTDAN